VYIQPTDVGVLDGAPSAEKTTRLIAKAETRLTVMLKRRGVSLSDLASDPDMLDVVRDVLENAVLRVLRNPEGASTESEGDYSIGYNPLDAAGNIWFPTADIDLLAPSSPFGTIQLGLPAHRRAW
jgi:hypothetical protein